MNEIELLRERIDDLHMVLIDVLKERFKYVRRIRDIKHKSSIKFEDRVRYNRMVSKLEEEAQKNHLPPGLIKEIIQVIHRHSLNEMHKKEESL